MNTAAPEAHRTPDSSNGRPAQAGATQQPARHPPAPQLPPPGGRTRWWVWVLILAAGAGATALIVHEIHAREAENQASGTGAGGRGGGRGFAAAAGRELPVVVATARRGDLPVYLSGLLGTVTPLKTVDVRTRVDGQITEIHYTEGQHVKAGDFLLQIDPRPYQAALDQAKGQLTKDQATLASAEWNVQQDRQAVQAISAQQLHTDTATRDSAKGAIEVDKANIEAAQVNLDYCHITSPIDGIAGLRQVDVGNIVHASDSTPLVVLTQEQPITVIFPVVEDDLEQLRRRMDAGQPVRVDAYDRTLTHRLARGTILAVDSAIDPTTGTIKVKAQFDNADHALFPSQFVNCRVLVDTVRGAVLVPSAAIQHNATGGTFVYVVNGADHTVKMHPVTTGPVLAGVGPEESDTTVVAAGLDAGGVVVTDGVDKLVDGMKVNPKTGDYTGGGGGRHGGGGATRPTTTPAEGPLDQTGVGGPAMDRPGAATRPSGHHRRQAD